MGKIGPSETGQAALLPLPSKSLANRRIENYSLPSDLVEEKTGLKSNDHGMEVLKVTKVSLRCFLYLKTYSQTDFFTRRMESFNLGGLLLLRIAEMW